MTAGSVIEKLKERAWRTSSEEQVNEPTDALIHLTQTNDQPRNGSLSLARVNDVYFMVSRLEALALFLRSALTRVT